MEKLTAKDACLLYLKAAKYTLGDNREKYDEFLGVMKDFQTKRLDRLNATARLEEIFKMHPDLILTFTVFLPNEYCEVCLPPDHDQRPPNMPSLGFEEAFHLVNKIRKRFQGDNEHAYLSFLDILKIYREENKPGAREIYKQVAALFKDHPDLVLEFARFLPDI